MSNMSLPIYLDMDGVLCDFVGGSLKVHGKSLPPKEISWDFWEQIGLSGEEFWAPLCNPDFWANLEPLEDGMGLYHWLRELCDQDRIVIMSSGLCPGSVDGKREWMKKHAPDLLKNATFCTAKHVHAGPGRLLIDDHEPNVGSFRMRGGDAILIPRPWNSLAHETCSRGMFSRATIADQIIRHLFGVAA